MQRSTTRQQYSEDYRKARILKNRYGAMGTDTSLCLEARLSLYILKGVNRPMDRVLEFSEMFHDPQMRPLLFTGLFKLRKSDYPAASRFFTVIVVRREDEPLSKTGEIYRAFERMSDGSLYPLFVSGSTFDDLRALVNRYQSHKRNVFIAEAA